MGNPVFIPKDDQRLPDSYKVKVFYVSGKVDELELANHWIRDKVIVPVDQSVSKYEVAACPFLEYLTKEDLWGWIPISSIQRLEFDKDFSKIVAIKEERERKRRS